MKFEFHCIFFLVIALFLGCTSEMSRSEADSGDLLLIDGSSTVYPITAQVVKEYSGGRFTYLMKVSGTGGGFRKFCKGETVINNASRQINFHEQQMCLDSGVSYQVFPIAIDGLAIVTNDQTSFIDYLTLGELKRIWGEPDAQLWSDIRKDWPKREIRLYGPGEASGTYDYFREAVLGEGSNFRSGYRGSENDNTIVREIVNNEGSLGYFGLAYYEKNKENLRVIPIDCGGGPILPTQDNITAGKYAPLVRTLYLYVNENLLKEEDGRSFIEFYLKNAGKVSAQLGYLPLSEQEYHRSVVQLNAGSGMN